jgi:hypothetical protein
MSFTAHWLSYFTVPWLPMGICDQPRHPPHLGNAAQTRLKELPVLFHHTVNFMALGLPHT